MDFSKSVLLVICWNPVHTGHTILSAMPPTEIEVKVFSSLDKASRKVGQVTVPFCPLCFQSWKKLQNPPFFIRQESKNFLLKCGVPHLRTQKLKLAITHFFGHLVAAETNSNINFLRFRDLD